MRSRRVLVATTALVAATTLVASPGRPDAATSPAQRVVMFTDSVGLGARNALPRAFPADWVVNVDGQPARFVEQLENDFVKPRLATNPQWFGDHVVIAGGYNYPYWDPERFERSIDSMVATLTNAGVRHVHWVTLREVKPEYISAAAWRQVQPYYWYFPEVNDHLEAALDRHPNLRLVDWAAVADRTGITYDAIHLNTAGAELYSRIVRDSVDAAATSVADNSITRVVVPDAEGRRSAAVNITTTDPRRNGHLRLWDCEGDPPPTAVHNHRRAETVAHTAVAPLNDDGEFCVFARTSTNLVIDVTGTFDRGLLPVTPARWEDTRRSSGIIPPGASIPLHIDDVLADGGLPDRPAAVALIVTAVDPEDAGWLRVGGCIDDGRTTANVNYPLGASTPNLVIAEPDADGYLCVTSRSRTHVVVDLVAAFGDAAGVRAQQPVRWYDSRDGDRLPAGTVTELDVAEIADGSTGPDASVIVNVSGVDPDGRGFVTLYPCADGRPLAANLNVGAERVTSNATIVEPDGDGMICVYQHATMHLVVDLMGTIGADGFAGRRPIRVLDTRR